MQEWMIAMLVISIMLIIRDMAKTILAENLPDTQELLTLQEGTGREIRSIFSETGRYFLWNAISQRLPEQQAG
jgi:hypothetical protein